jgi:hypothetical protein
MTKGFILVAFFLTVLTAKAQTGATNFMTEVSPIGSFSCFTNCDRWGHLIGNYPTNPMPITAIFQRYRNDYHGQHRYTLLINNETNKPLEIRIVTFFEDQRTNFYWKDLNSHGLYSNERDADGKTPFSDNWRLEGIYKKEIIQIQSDGYDPIWLYPSATFRQFLSNSSNEKDMVDMPW